MTMIAPMMTRTEGMPPRIVSSRDELRHPSVAVPGHAVKPGAASRRPAGARQSGRVALFKATLPKATLPLSHGLVACESRPGS